MVAVSLSAVACNLFGSDDSPEITEIFGYWRLELIAYDNGKILAGASDQVYWVQFREDLMEWEGEMFHRVSGGAYCNWSEGWFGYTEEGDIDISFICSRLVCGIATEFCNGMSTANRYSLKNGKLTMYFDSQSGGKGILIFKPFNPNVEGAR